MSYNGLLIFFSFKFSGNNRSDLLNDAKNVGGDVLNKVIDGAKDAGAGAKDVAQDAASAVSGGVGTAVDKIKDVASTVGEGAGDAVNTVKDFFGGLFGGRRRLLVDNIASCGYRACAPGSNEKAHVLYVLYKASTSGASTTGLVPRFNVFQVNYADLPTQGVVQTAQQLNEAWAAQYAAGVEAGPLVMCAWVVDNGEFKAQMVCLDHGAKAVGLKQVEELFVPKGLQLVGLRGGAEVGSVCGGQRGLRMGGAELSSKFAGSFESMTVKSC